MKMCACVSIFVMQFVPGSLRYLVNKDRSDKVVAILAQTARINRVSLLEGKLVILEEKYISYNCLKRDKLFA